MKKALSLMISLALVIGMISVFTASAAEPTVIKFADSIGVEGMTDINEELYGASMVKHGENGLKVTSLRDGGNDRAIVAVAGASAARYLIMKLDMETSSVAAGQTTIYEAANAPAQTFFSYAPLTALETVCIDLAALYDTIPDVISLCIYAIGAGTVVAFDEIYLSSEPIAVTKPLNATQEASGTSGGYNALAGGITVTGDPLTVSAADAPGNGNYYFATAHIGAYPDLVYEISEEDLDSIDAIYVNQDASQPLPITAGVHCYDMSQRDPMASPPGFMLDIYVKANSSVSFDQIYLSTLPYVAEDDSDDNTGDDNTGDDNTGDDNTGDDNTGNDNTGNDDNKAPDTGAISLAIPALLAAAACGGMMISRKRR